MEIVYFTSNPTLKISLTINLHRSMHAHVHYICGFVIKALPFSLAVIQPKCLPT